MRNVATELSRAVPQWDAYHRLVPSRFPPINIFENLVDAAKLGVVFAVESLTNDRLRDEAGDISLVESAERVVGPGATPIMAAFTHIGKPSRFTNGEYGVFYAASSVAAAISETKYHRAQFLAATHQPPQEITMREYVGRCDEELIDIRGPAWQDLHDPDPANYPKPQRFGRRLRDKGELGVLYYSVRYSGAECLGAFKPTAVGLPIQGGHYRYVWDGDTISNVLSIAQFAGV